MEIKPGDIIQITDRSHPWFPALLIVDEIKGFGVQACCLIPESNQEGPCNQAYNRLTTGSFEKVGEAAICVRGDDDDA